MSIPATIRLAGCASMLLASAALAQQPQVDQNRVFTTPLHWHRVSFPEFGGGTMRVADGSLAIFYQDGTYAAVTASFNAIGKERHVSLDLKGGSILWLGTWTKTDDKMIRIDSRQVQQDGQPALLACAPGTPRTGCHPAVQSSAPGRTVARSCRLDKPSVEHLSDILHCNGGAGLTLVHPAEPVDLSDLPEIVSRLRKAAGTP